MSAGPRPFELGETVAPGETRHLYLDVGETYLGAPIEIPVTVVNGARAGPRLLCSAAMHGDELNGVSVVHELARRYDPEDLAGTLVLVHVMNVPGYIAQQRYLPIYDQDLNRLFPGSEHGSTGSRMARRVYDRLVSRCDMVLDFHTSTRNRMTLFHVRADTSDPAVADLVDAFGARLVLDGAGSTKMLRRVASDAGVPTLTVEMGEAQRFQPRLVEMGLRGVENVLATYGMLPAVDPRPVSYRMVVGHGESTWVRAPTGGLVEMHWGPYPVVDEGDPICTVSNHFQTETDTVVAPFDGLLIGIVANPHVQPGHPLVHLARIDDVDRDEIERIFDEVGFSQHGTFHWMGRDVSPA
ncbi:succinylglutamate desuccinylase/aspartoacylase family protein [Halomarina rubra]|uniref:Succinylglutamate desuccinylase/aspartoacylase family protein n=1 Tax=Halomarina rubra TaxID=2071873 RepID=A0ABD6AQA1_9EURY|nr:succinylglutamate desuccinylase/aspartoacylase family protein [Halomarina rubra]